MPIIIKDQDIMAIVPKLLANPKEIRLTRTIAGAYEDRCRCFWMRGKPAAYLVIAFNRWKCNIFSGKIEFIRAKGILIKHTSLVRACHLLYNIQSYSKHYPYRSNASTQT